MKRQKLKVFNSCRHSSTMNNVSENKLFTVLLNQRTMLGIALLLSTLLPLNHAAPTAKSSSYLNASQIETTSISSSLPTSTAAELSIQLNSTIPLNKINDKVVSSPVGSDDIAASSSPPSHIEKILSNDKVSSIEYNHNADAIKSDSVKTTTLASTGSSNNYLDTNNHPVSPITNPTAASQAPVTTSVDDAIDKNANSDNKAENASTLPTTLARNEDIVTTTTTFILNSQRSENGLSTSRSENINKNPTQETIFTAESSTQTAKPTSIATEFTTVRSSSDNVTPSSPTSSLTEIDGLLPNINAKEHLNGGQPGVQSEVGNPLSTVANIQTNDSDKNRDVATVANENKKLLETTTDVGQPEIAQTPILIKSASDTTTTTSPDAEIAATAPNTNVGGKITKVFDEEKSNNKKVMHESLSNNNKKYNNKNNKDKSKMRANEEGGVYDPNDKLNDNLSMEVISTVPQPATVFASDIGSAVSHTTTIRSMESHLIDGDSFDKNKANISKFDEIHTESVINADVTNSAPSAHTNIGDTHIPTALNGINSVSTAAVPTKTENTPMERTTQKDVTMDEKPTLSTTFKPEASETKDSISEITSLNEKQLLTEKPEVTGSNDSNKHSNGNINEMNKSDNELTHTNNDIKTTIKPTPEKPSILDYDKSSEEIFHIVHETSTSKTEVSSVAQKRPHDSVNDEFFLPADDLDTDTMVTASAAASSTTQTTADATTTTMQSTIPINTESSIVRPNTGALEPTITVPIPIVTSDSKQQQNTELNKASTISRDSDTIFYISNTEVKVVESSVPTPNTKQENRQFFPALFQEDIIVDFSGKNSSAWNTGLDGPGDKYEEDIILSPMKSNFDPTKLNDENLSISYVGESFIDIKEATSDDMSAGSDSNAQNNDISSESKENVRSFGDNAISSNVIIEPVVIPDVQQSIGVPIIAELPSQINIRDLDYKNNAIQLNNSGNSISSHFPTHPGDNLQKARELSAELPKTDSEEVTAILDDDKIDIGKNETQKSNTTAEAITNVTAFSSVLDENPEANWNDIQTIIVIALLTIVPSIGCLILIVAIRKVYRKAISLRDGNSSGTNGNVLLRDSSTDPLAMNSHTISTDELKTTDCEANGINHSNDNLISNAEITSIQCDERAAGHAGQMNHHSGANGSLITMTMKNNHLIVETEERSDIARDVRETKVHYSPSEKDGVFVVEVARGADSNTTPIMANIAGAAMAIEQMTVSPRQTQATIVEMAEEQPKSVDYASSNDGNVSCTRSNEKVLVHPPPNHCMDEDVLMIDEDGAVSMSSPKHNGLDEACGGVAAGESNINTGLSQSDLSVSSSDGSNQAYSYGQQEPYTVESNTYQSTSPHIAPIAPIAPIEPMEALDLTEVTEAGIPTPEPITVISDTEHENQINENESPEKTVDDTFNAEPLPTIDTINENQIPTTDNGIILSKALKTTAEIDNDNGNNMNGNGPEHHHQQNGFKSHEIITTNGKLNGDHQNGFNGNDHLTDDSNDFDSLMNLPAPPTCDEIKQFNDITTLDNGNMDSLPPPPPESFQPTAACPINVES